MIIKRWYTGMELFQGEKPKWYLGEAHASINMDAKLYMIIPLNYFFRAYQALYYWMLRP